MKRKGTLFVVSTPIGNLKDITLRALEVLRGVDLIIVENKRRALKLLNSYGIKKHLISLPAYKEERKVPSLVALLQDGKDCALTVSAGTPSISDPGRALVRACLREGIEVKAVPGPSAVSASVSVAGLKADRFLFYGFLPKRKGERQKVLKELSQIPFAVVLFESKERLLETLTELQRCSPQREVVLLKELTKMHETVLYGTMDHIVKLLELEVPKGEYTLILDGLEM